jgi:para-aminobenzoate synthetase component 1
MRLKQSLPYFEDSARLFEAIADKPWAVMLDSGPGHSRRGRYDILAADPYLTLVTRGEHTEIRGREDSSLSVQDPFELLRDVLQAQDESDADLPFFGGAIGYFGYDLARRIETLPALAENDEQLPEMALGIYDWAVVVDHERRRSWLASAGRDPRTRERWFALVELLKAAPEPGKPNAFTVSGQVASSLDYAQYADAFRRIQDYIRNGDCYQVNFAQRFRVGCSGDPWHAYRQLRDISPAPFAAYMKLPFVQVLSASPERFVRLHDGEVLTQPIKGTRPRSAEPGADWMLGQSLLQSAKDRAENVMIVDLLRNDLSKSCALDSVRVPRLFELQSFATVHHLVTTITGQLKDGCDAVHLLRGCFPGGSITGAPKVRVMEIIEELEPYRRGVYCGSIAYIGFDGRMDSNIAIRTITHAQGQMHFWAGGGITVDSTLDGEYQEAFDKAAAMLQLFKRKGTPQLQAIPRVRRTNTGS